MYKHCTVYCCTIINSHADYNYSDLCGMCLGSMEGLSTVLKKHQRELFMSSFEIFYYSQ